MNWSLSHLIAPRICRVCGCSLAADEDVMCLQCMLDMPLTRIHADSFNDIHQRLGHTAHVDRAAAWFSYHSGSQYAKLLVDAKYASLPLLARKLGRLCAQQLARDGFFDGIDVLAPMPMHWRKRLHRGYNQAYEICLGISDVTGIAVSDALRAIRGHGVQSRQSKQARYTSIAGTLAVKDASAYGGRHVLFVDDIITTGASAAEAIRALQAAAPAAISVLCLGLTALR